jgi:hypothetical protein
VKRISIGLAQMMIKRNSGENKVIKMVIYLEKASLQRHKNKNLQSRMSQFKWAFWAWMSTGMNRATSTAKLPRCHRWHRRQSMQHLLFIFVKVHHPRHWINLILTNNLHISTPHEYLHISVVECVWTSSLYTWSNHDKLQRNV